MYNNKKKLIGVLRADINSEMIRKLILLYTFKVLIDLQ